jgi:hypothetical protein
MSPQSPLLRTALALAFAPAFAFAAPPPPATTTLLDLRLRHEAVDDAGFDKEAAASTLRLRAGLKHAFNAQFSALLEFEGTTHFGSDRFNSTDNGQLAYPAVVDPDNAEINQAWLAWTPDAATRIAIGRQKINIDNQRFVGASSWRQNEQTFDALEATHGFSNGVQLRYDYFGRVQRANGADNRNENLARWLLDAHLFNAGGKLGPGRLAGYGYFIENRTLPLSSHRDLGLRYVVDPDDQAKRHWGLALEAAQQSPYAEGADRNHARYWLAEGSWRWRAHTFRLGQEVLGGDGHYGFSTPLATLHAFNGWADRFLNTPADGLRDRYLGWNRKFGRWEANIVAHDFQADHGGRDFGNELDASLGVAITPHWTALAKLADFTGDQGPIDVDKTWLSLEYKR